MIGAEGAARSIDQLLEAARVTLGMDLTFLSRIRDGEQSFEQVSNPQGAMGLQAGVQVAADGAYCGRMLSGDIPNVVGDVRAHPTLGPLPVTAAMGVGAYCGVPVRLPDGSVYGTLCGLDGQARPDLSADQVAVLEVISSLLGTQVAQLLEERQALDRRRTALLHVLDEGGLSIVLQPIVDVSAARTSGYEALSRFRRSDPGPTRPDLVFAEATGLGLGTTFELAAAAAALALLPDLPQDTYLSLNLSAATLADARTVPLLQQAPVGRLLLEITEHDAVEDYDTVRATVTALRRAGLRLAIDDVGAGYSSLRHILRLAPDVLKIDISIIRGIDAAPAQRAMVAALVGFAAETGAEVVSEGVETAAERDALLELGVRLMQGYLLGRPAAWPQEPRDVTGAA